MAPRTTKARERHRKKQASALLSAIGVIGFVTVVIASFITKQSIPGIVIAFFAAVSLPPEVLRKFLKGWMGK